MIINTRINIHYFNIILILLFSIVSTSCSTTYYLASLKAASLDVEQDNKGRFHIETDSVWITYNFNGEQAPISITIYNNSSSTLRVDWVKSGIIMDDILINYAGNNFDPEKVRPSMNIPPNSSKEKVPMILNVNLGKVKSKDYKILTNANSKLGKIKQAEYGLDESPIYFKSYLAIYTQYGDLWEFEDGFYLHKILKFKNITTEDLPRKETNRGDIFYVEKAANKKTFDGFVNGLNITRLILVDVLAGSSESSDNEYQDYNYQD